MNIRHFLYRFFVVSLKIFLGCLLGCAMVLYFASRSEVVHQEIKKSIQNMFKRELNCDWDGQLESIDLLFLEIKFNHASMLPCNRSDGWSLYTDKFHASASWLDFLWHGRFSCHSYFEQVVVYEKQADDKSHFVQVLLKIFSSSLPSSVSFDFITIKQGQMILQDAAGLLQGGYEYNCQMSREPDGVHTKLYLLDGHCSYKNRRICENVFGNFISIIPYNNDLQKIYARADFRVSIPELQEKGACFLKGDLYAGRGAFVLSNEDQSFIIEPLKFKLKENAIPTTCSITIALELLQRFMLHEIIMPDLSGDVTITLMGNMLDLASGLQGKIQLQNIAYKNSRLIDRAFMTFYKDNGGYKAKFFVNSVCALEGSSTPTNNGWQFDVINKIEISPWWMSYWKMAAGQGAISGSLTHNLLMQGKYSFSLESAKLDSQAKVEGNFTCSPQEFNLQGSFLDQSYECIFDFDPTPHLVQLRCFSQTETFIDFHEHADPLQGTVGYVGFNFIKNLLADQYKSSFSQPGKIKMSGYLRQGSYFADAVTDDAHIRIPSLYNVVQNFKTATQFDFVNRSITVQNLVAHLYEGTIRCDKAVGIFDTQTQLSFLHLPMFLDKVLISWYKGVFGILSGRLFLSLDEQQPLKLQGNLIMDKTQLKGNIFSTEFQEHLLGQISTTQPIEGDCDLDISIQTKDPISIETSFLQATAHLDIHVSNTIKQPEIEGSIDLVGGELKFPYKSLFITHGQVLIMPKNSSEPMIEFFAKGKIKRYNITMRATGTMMDQQIHFDASPYLSEEQIISLLLVGSQDSSLSVVMPAMFMQKLHEIVFGPAISKSKLDVIFNRLLQSFKNVRIFPQFTNQAGRGGVRGVIEVDATDRLHGRIDSNLMQLEDTIFEADYALTDDVTVRAIKDGPSTYGGEVEMRWKFS